MYGASEQMKSPRYMLFFPPPGANAVGSAVAATTIATSAAHVPTPAVYEGAFLVSFDIRM